EEEADDERMDVGARRLGEQQQAAGLQHAMPFAQRLFLLDEVVERLVAEDEVDARVRKLERRDVAAAQVDRDALFLGLLARLLEAALLRVDGDDLLGREMLDQRAEGLPLAAACVEDDRIRGAAIGDERSEILQRDAHYARGPGLGSEEP